MKFVKSREPTPHVFIANTRGDAEAIRHKYAEVLGISPVAVVFLNPSQTLAVVTFPCPTTAGRALDASPGLGFRSAAYSCPAPDSTPKDPFPTLINVSASGSLVPGLIRVFDFITEEEEQRLLSGVRDSPWEEGIRRRVQHYGYAFDYTIRGVHRDAPKGDYPPAWLGSVAQRVAAAMPSAPDQLTVNEYPPGTGISPHIDTHSAFHDGIASLSLGSDTVMNFQLDSTTPAVQVLLPSRSLVIMTGPSRYAYTHAIPKRKNDRINGVVVKRDTRISLTFRAILFGQCPCTYPELCE